MKNLTALFRRPFSSRSTTLASLAVIAAAILFSVAAVSGDDGDEHRRGRGIEGTWLVTVTSDGSTPFPALVTFGGGGAVVVTDSSAAPSLGNVYQGTWAKTGGREFTFTFLGFSYDETGAHSNFFKVQETIELDRSGTSYNGEAMGSVLDLDGNELVAFEITTHGERIDAE